LLQGLREYLDAEYNQSIFSRVLESKAQWMFHLHGHRVITGVLDDNQPYDLAILLDTGQEEQIPKLHVKFLYPVESADPIQRLIKIDKKLKSKSLEPILAPSQRHHIKNKTLYPLMQEKHVVFFNLLEGEVVRGLVTGFTRYDITVSMKGGVPLTILRHSIFDLRNKKGRCFLKSFQDIHRDWKTSPVYEPEHAPKP